MTNDYPDVFDRDDAPHAPQPVHWNDNDTGEAWEVEYDLYEREDWPRLIRYRLEVLRRHPHDPVAQCGVGDAYVDAGQYQEALDYLPPCIVKIQSESIFNGVS